MKKLLALLLAMLMLTGVFASCAKKPADNGDVGGGETTAPEAPKFTLMEAGKKTDYIIIYPDDADGQLVQQINTLIYQMNESFEGIDIMSQPAMKEWGEDFYCEHEILIGDTGRPESDDAHASIGDKDFIVKYYSESGKLVISAKNEEYLPAAISYFLTTYVLLNEDGQLMLEEGLDYVETDTEDKRKGWLINAIPYYEGGTLSTSVYGTGRGADMNSSGGGGNMQVISDTNKAEFLSYLEKLSNNGYTQTAYHTIGSNIYAQYYSGARLIYTYYTDYEKETRVIYDAASIPENQFEYTYTAKSTDTTTFYQYSIMHNITGEGGQDLNNNEKLWENCGLFDVIKLADNSVILLDGGFDDQATDKAVEECMKFLREITGTPAGQKVRIAAMYFTHGHGDHVSFSYRLVKNHSDEITVERLMHNLAPQNELGEEFVSLGALLKQKYPNMKFAKLHTGQCIQLANVKFEVVYTHEDMVSPEGITEIKDYNNTSTMLKMTMNGKTFLLTGDWGGGHVDRDKYEYKPMEASIINTFKLSDGSNYLKCDVLQVSHHAINDWMSNFYTVVDPDIAFFPQQDITYNKMAHACYKNIVNQLRTIGVTDSNMFFAGKYTYGITVASNGTMNLSYRKIAGADDIYLSQFNKYSPFHAPQSGVVPFK